MLGNAFEVDAPAELASNAIGLEKSVGSEVTAATRMFSLAVRSFRYCWRLCSLAIAESKNDKQIRMSAERNIFKAT